MCIQFVPLILLYAIQRSLALETFNANISFFLFSFVFCFYFVFYCNALKKTILTKLRLLYTSYTTDYYKLYTNYTTYDYKLYTNYKMNTNYTTYNARVYLRYMH